MIKKYFILASLSATIVFHANCQVNADTVKEASREVIMNIDYGSLINNYPSILMSIDYAPNSKWLHGIFAGPVLEPELNIIRQRDKKDDSGYILGFESKYFYRDFLNDNKTKAYVGVRYQYTHASFRSNHILKVTNPNDFYYQNVDNEYKINIHSYSIKTGVITSTNKNIYFGVGLGIGYFNKSISPEARDFGSEVVKNSELVYGIDKSNIYYSLELKIGWLLFKVR